MAFSVVTERLYISMAMWTLATADLMSALSLIAPANAAQIVSLLNQGTNYTITHSSYHSYALSQATCHFCGQVEDGTEEVVEFLFLDHIRKVLVELDQCNGSVQDLDRVVDYFCHSTQIIGNLIKVRHAVQEGVPQ